jgi:hypothetical protein
MEAIRAGAVKAWRIDQHRLSDNYVPAIVRTD